MQRKSSGWPVGVRLKISFIGTLFVASALVAAKSTEIAADAINTLGLEILAKASAPDRNALLSPYSIQCALAMIYAGAEGKTRTEISKALHYPSDEIELHESFHDMRKTISHVAEISAEQSKRMRDWDSTNDAITIKISNQLFGQEGFSYRKAFLDLAAKNYGARVELLDFTRDTSNFVERINEQIAAYAGDQIPEVVGAEELNRHTRLVLVSTAQLKAPWAHKFSTSETKTLPFQTASGSVEVPTMYSQGPFYLGKATSTNGSDTATVIALPLMGGDLQFLIIMPDKADNLAALEAEMVADGFIRKCATRSGREAVVNLPRFKLQSTSRLNSTLRLLGIESAFDGSEGGANFSRLASPPTADNLFLSEIFHIATLKVDEHGLEASAEAMPRVPRPVPTSRIDIDRPFLFAVQHRWSGVCLLLGRVVDPR